MKRVHRVLKAPYAASLIPPATMNKANACLAACWPEDSKKVLRYSERAGKGTAIDGLVQMADEHRKLGQWKMVADKLEKATHM